jgi:phage-related protein
MLSGVYFFVDERGHKPVDEFLMALTKKERAKALAYFIELNKQGYNLRRPLADYVGNGIYELRPRNNRIFYFFYLRDKAVLVHAIKKKTGRIPQEDLKLCVKRKDYVEALGRVERIELFGDRYEKS